MSVLHAWFEYKTDRGEVRRIPMDSSGQMDLASALTSNASSQAAVTISQEGTSFIARDQSGNQNLHVNRRPTKEAKLTNLDIISFGKHTLTFHATYLPHPKLQIAPPPDKRRREVLFPWGMLVNSSNFWAKAFDQPLLHPKVSGLFTLLSLATLLTPVLSTDRGATSLLAALVLVCTVLFLIFSMMASVFFGFRGPENENSGEISTKINHAFHFVYYVAPFLLGTQSLFLTQAIKSSWHFDEYFEYGAAPTAFLVCFLAWQTQTAFKASLGKSFSFGALAAIPWYLLMTGLMYFLI